MYVGNGTAVRVACPCRRTSLVYSTHKNRTPHDTGLHGHVCGMAVLCRNVCRGAGEVARGAHPAVAAARAPCAAASRGEHGKAEAYLLYRLYRTKTPRKGLAVGDGVLRSHACLCVSVSPLTLSLKDSESGVAAAGAARFFRSYVYMYMLYVRPLHAASFIPIHECDRPTDRPTVLVRCIDDMTRIIHHPVSSHDKHGARRRTHVTASVVCPALIARPFFNWSTWSAVL